MMNRLGVDNPTVLLSQYQPVETINHLAPLQQAGTSKPRRHRRRKEKGGRDGNGAAVSKKRKLSLEQVTMLEQSFERKQKMETQRKDRLAAELGLEPQQVAVWFQNRRARWRSKKLGEEYAKLQSNHEALVLEKGFLETQMIKLMEQLEEANKKIQTLLEHQHGFTTNIPNSSSLLSMDTNVVGPSFWSEFANADEEFEKMFYLPWTTSSHVDLEGLNLYSM